MNAEKQRAKLDKLSEMQPDEIAAHIVAMRNALPELLARLATSEAALQKIVDHDLYDDFVATRIAREALEALHAER